MASKYINSILLIREQPLSNTNSGSCVFNDIYNQVVHFGNERDCSYIDCDDCIFNKDILISDIEAISYEQTD